MGLLSRPVTVRYSTVEDLYTERDQLPWFWRLGAFAASWLILGGFLTLPAQFDGTPDLSVSQTGLAVFSVAILTAGCSLTALILCLVKNPMFRSDFVLLPALSSSVLGLLTLTYCFLTSRRYGWNTASLLTLIASLMASISYGGLLWWTQRQTSMIRNGLVTGNPRRSRHRSRSPREVISVHQQSQSQSQLQPQAHYRPSWHREPSISLSLDDDVKSVESGSYGDDVLPYKGHFAPPGPSPFAQASPPLAPPLPAATQAKGQGPPSPAISRAVSAFPG